MSLKKNIEAEIFMVVVFDSNIWLSELGLNSTLGSATRFFLKKNNARIALPEVIRLEVEQNFRNRIIEHVSDIEKNYRQLLGIFGVLKEIVLPDDEQINQKIEAIFSDLGVDIYEIEFSARSAKNSFMKTIKKVPPCDKSQEFKDGVLWADCVALLEQENVFLVTSDKAFYANREYAKGLAVNLSEEIQFAKNSLKIFSSLSGLLEEIRIDYTIDVPILVNELLSKSKMSIEDVLMRIEYELTQSYDVIYSVFVTENPSVLFLEYKAIITIQDSTGQNRAAGSLVISGDGALKDELIISDELRVSEEEFIYFDGGKEQKIVSSTVYVSGIVLGHKNISHDVKYNLSTNSLI